MILNKRTAIFVIFLAAWVFLARDYCSWLSANFKTALALLPLPAPEKHRFVDASLYDYGISLDAQVPKNATIVVKNMCSGLQQFTTDWIKAEYDTQRLGFYYLAPRPVIRADARYTRTDTYRLVYHYEPSTGKVYVRLYFPGEKESDVF